MRRFVLSIFIAGLLSGQVFASELTGRTIILAGDILKIAGQVIRLQGIDAPESYQICYHANGSDYLCGDESHLFLLDFIGQKQVYCTFEELDERDRPIATCFVGSANINRAMVSAGWALPAQGTKTYEIEKAAAQNAKKGIWGGKFCAPYLVRSRRCTPE